MFSPKTKEQAKSLMQHACEQIDKGSNYNDEELDYFVKIINRFDLGEKEIGEKLNNYLWENGRIIRE